VPLVARRIVTAVKGTVTPVLPSGWTPDKASFDYTVDPNQHTRTTVLVSIPADAAEGVYPIGMQTVYQGAVQRELHTYRVRIAK